MPEATVTPEAPAPPPDPAPKSKAKADAPKPYKIAHDLVGPFAKDTPVSEADLFPGVDDTAPLIARLVDLEAIVPNAE